jgi:pyruvate formate-lyase activating enzyme-like uncharacterized protein
MKKSFLKLWRQKLIDANLAEYGDRSDSLSWISPEQARDAESRRARMIEAFSSGIEFDFRGTKPHSGSLSPGCRICGEGAWSCLFINGKCNCRCFYCPTAQDRISVPATNRISFDTPRDYADYVRHFDFKGISISGGEPLLTFERSLGYIDAARKELGESLYIWLYTNGTLATMDRLEKLRGAGLNEIRFDISAVDYDLTRVRMAADILPRVTVEIPAIPEDLDRLLDLLPDLQDAGVKHLNLHQLRLTPHNLAELSERDYTFLHGEKVTVLESELAALTILGSVSRSGLKLPVNYCAFAYKRRYQQAATRRRNATHILKGHESVTENGFIRSLSLAGDPEALGRLASLLERDDGVDRNAWHLSGRKDQLFFHDAIWGKIDFSAGRLQAGYSEAMLSPSISYRYAFREVRLHHGRKIFLERRLLCPPFVLEEAERLDFEKSILHITGDGPDSDTSIREEILDLESIRPGLQDYF